jgi:hypothetical protein
LGRDERPAIRARSDCQVVVLVLFVGADIDFVFQVMKHRFVRVLNAVPDAPLLRRHSSWLTLTIGPSYRTEGIVSLTVGCRPVLDP